MQCCNQVILQPPGLKKKNERRGEEIKGEERSRRGEERREKREDGKGDGERVNRQQLRTRIINIVIIWEQSTSFVSRNLLWMSAFRPDRERTLGIFHFL